MDTFTFTSPSSLTPVTLSHFLVREAAFRVPFQQDCVCESVSVSVGGEGMQPGSAPP